jgi:hypothetical protein
MTNNIHMSVKSYISVKVEERKNKGSVKTMGGGLFFAQVTVKINCSKTVNMLFIMTL